MTPLKFDLDLSKEPAEHIIIHIRQGERNATVLEVSIYDFGVPVDLADFDVYFMCRQVDGKAIQDNEQLTTSENVITYTLSELVGAVPGRIETAYFSLKQGGKVHATTYNVYVNVLPSAEQEGEAWITRAYSSEIEAMLKKCADDYAKAEARRNAESEAAIERTDAAAGRADDAAQRVDEAMSGNLDPMFKTWVDGQKDVSGGLVSHDRYESNRDKAGGLVSFEKYAKDTEFLSDEEFLQHKPGNDNRHTSASNAFALADMMRALQVISFCGAGELEDFTIKLDEFHNAGEGWNTYKFPAPFEGPPTVFCYVEGYDIAIKAVNAEGFLYRVSTEPSGDSLSVTKTTYYVSNTSYSTSQFVAANLVTNVALKAGASSPPVAEAVPIQYVAIHYGGE